MEEENKFSNNLDVENMLQSSYEVDNESCEDSEVDASRSKITLEFSSPTRDMENAKILLEFVQAIKDDNCSYIKEFLEEDECNRTVLFQESYEGILPIQYAVLFGNIKAAEILFEHGATVDSMLEGMPLLHLSLSFSKRFREKLINHRDRLGRTILHLIFQNDLFECLSDKTIFQITNDDLFINDLNGDSVIDYAFIYDSRQCLNSIVENQVDGFKLYKEIIKLNPGFIDKYILDVVVNHAIQTDNIQFIDLLIEDFTAHLTNLDRESESEENIPSSKKNIIDHYLKKLQGENITITDNKEEDSNNHLNKTLIVYNPKCTLHGDFTDSNPLMRLKRRMNQVENPDRINVLFQPPFGVLLSDFCIERFSFREVQQPACLADILRVHDYNYIESIYKYCNRLKDQNSNNCYKYDSDTYINQHSWESAIHAAGCVIDAVDQIMDNEGTINKVTNAFCLVRPPGHHAGYYGKVESQSKHCHSSNGFCFLNNVAIGAAYSMYKYQDKIKKIAIVDFDVHHGNGTQEIIKFLSKTDVSIKSENKFGEVTVSQSICKPWRDFNDAENVLFISTHGYDEEAPGRFYPSSGTLEENTEKDSDIYPGGILNVPINGDKKLSYGYRNMFRTKIIPRLIKFKPDIIFVSAGFDGHANEHINSSYMKLTEFDYRWITEELMRIANRFSNGRLISVLEGGYNINNGVVASFAQSVLYHAKFLNICANKNKEKCLMMSKVKRKREFLKDYDNYKTFKRNRYEMEAENMIKDEKQNEILKHEQRYSFRSSQVKEVATHNYNNKEEYDLSKTDMNLKFLNKNQEIIEMDRIKTDMNLNVDESDVEYMKVIENDYDKNYNPFSINNFDIGIPNKSEIQKDDEELLKIKTEKMVKNVIDLEYINRQDDDNYFASEEIKQEVNANSDNNNNITKQNENLNYNNYNGDNMLYEEIEVEMDEDDPIA